MVAVLVLPQLPQRELMGTPHRLRQSTPQAVEVAVEVIALIMAELAAQAVVGHITVVRRVLAMLAPILLQKATMVDHHMVLLAVAAVALVAQELMAFQEARVAMVPRLPLLAHQ